MQAAGGGVGLAAELPARVQRGHDDLERALVRKLGVRVDRDAAAIVADRDPVRGRELELDPVGVAGHGLVHRIVEHLGDQMVQGALVRAADIHARPAAHRLQALEDLDVVRGVALTAAVAGEVEEVRHSDSFRWARQLGRRTPCGIRRRHGIDDGGSGTTSSDPTAPKHGTRVDADLATGLSCVGGVVNRSAVGSSEEPNLPQSDQPGEAVMEQPPDGTQPEEPTVRELRQRVRQQELLSELGVQALKGTPFDGAAGADRAIRRRGHGRRVRQGVGVPAKREAAVDPSRSRLATRALSARRRRRRSGIAGGLRTAHGQARDLEPSRERGTVPDARAAGGAWHPPGHERHSPGRRLRLRRPRGRQPVRRRVRRAGHRIPAGCGQSARHGDRAAADRDEPARGGRSSARCCCRSWTTA